MILYDRKSLVVQGWEKEELQTGTAVMQDGLGACQIDPGDQAQGYVLNRKVF